MTQLPNTLPAFIWHFIKKWPIAFAVFFTVPMLLVLEANVLPYALKKVIDGITAHENDKAAIFTAISPYLWMGAGCWLIFLTAARLQHVWQAFIIPKFEADIRLSVFSYLNQHSYQYFADHLSGSLSNKISDLPRAINTIRMVLSWNIIGTSAVVIVSLSFMYYVHPLFCLIFALWICCHLSVALYFAINLSKKSEIDADVKSELSGAIVDSISNVTGVKLFARRLHELAYVGTYQNREIKTYKKMILAENWLHLAMDIPMLTVLCVLSYFLITFWQQGQIVTSDVVFVFNTFWALTFNMWFLGQALGSLFREIGVAKQALATIIQPHNIKDHEQATKLKVNQGKIEFEHVTFNYKRNANLFKDKQVLIEPGTKVGLVGFSGSGKTTFVNLILRFFEVESGRILIDGQDIAMVTQDSLHENIAMIPQDSSLFHRSLFDNIAYGRSTSSQDEVIEAAKAAHCHDFIVSLPEGYNSLVGERGVKLSGGQRQRIAIARAILKNAPILILDEATSSLDSVTEDLIQDSLKNIMKNRTTIVIAHRLSTLALMDRILVFDQGQIIEDGTHKDLLKLEGHYARMWQMQAGGFLPESSK